MSGNLTAKWVDSGREPKCPPDPKFPDGLDLDASRGAARTCTIALPYPARRCGYYEILCPDCGMSIAVTTAGRRDDPRHVTLGCWANTLEPNPPGMVEVVLPDSPGSIRTPHTG